MIWAKLLLYGLLGWTAIGLLGSMVSGLRRGDWPKARRGWRMIAVVWGMYLGVLLLVSRNAPERVVPQGTPQCFADLCNTVERVEELRGFAGRGQTGGRLLRVAVRVNNRDRASAAQDRLVRTYVEDGRGRRWYALPGVSGVPLTRAIPAGGSVLSEPIYAIAPDAHDLSLVLTHGHWQPGRLVVGDPDSFLHPPVRMHLVEPATVLPYAP